MKGFGGGYEKENPPLNRMYPARIVIIADLGTQPGYQGGEPRHTLMIGYELVDPAVRRKDGKPFVITESPGVSSHSRSTVVARVQALLNVQFPKGNPDGNQQSPGFYYNLPDDFVQNYLKKLLGMGIMVTVSANANGNAKIAMVSLPMPNMTIPEAESALSWFDMEADKDQWESDFLALPDWIKKMIHRSEEMSGPRHPVQSQVSTPAGVHAGAQAVAGGPAHEDDIPF